MVQSKATTPSAAWRASIYNAMPIEGGKRLVEYMREFKGNYG